MHAILNMSSRSAALVCVAIYVVWAVATWRLP